jgi:hypothetical protein
VHESGIKPEPDKGVVRIKSGCKTFPGAEKQKNVDEKKEI